ncbi:Protein prenyltransferase alpha subunit repeat-containing protein 1 [Quillaja saponaria]|uniref:Protein prenyltransferase alpha subunit repeat-containing protein 1 n=1 Tax=Quillaja saponaria TaxID=32244 RepID=A0AAD7VJN5_QUISA|nr:Protein prenyltransferase alpha subunit repeat-containing protein 1 [Quillaja saponaria]
MEESYSEGRALNLLNQLEEILESDPLIDEVGFIHSSQFSMLDEEAGSSLPSSGNVVLESVDSILSSVGLPIDASKQENLHFWNRDHKLGIATHVLLQLYKAAKHEFITTIRQYKALSNQSAEVGKSRSSFSTPYQNLESTVMRHSRSLLLLSPDFLTAWNSRKLVISKKHQLSIFLDELLLSALVLSYSPKSEQAWNHRRWVIKSISGTCSSLQDIVRKESELVEKIAERTKMNYRAWNHRCWLVSYMTREQVLDELKKSKHWAGLHIADNCCFHYRRRLLLRIFACPSCMTGTASSGYDAETFQVWKDELDWNETLIKQYVGREALWLHRRFLSLCWIKYFLTDFHEASYSKDEISTYSSFATFLNNELGLLKSCSTIVDGVFEDFETQAMYSASYMLWLKMQAPKPLGIQLLEMLRGDDLKNMLNKSCPERSSLWSSLMSETYP